MNGSPDILFVDDELHIRQAAQQMLELAGYAVKVAPTAEEALRLVSRRFSGVVVTDIRMPKTDGIDLLRDIVQIDRELPTVLITGHGDIELAVRAMREGAYDFIEKPYTSERLLDSVARALEKRSLTLEIRRLRDEISGRKDNLEARLVGRSQIMIQLRETIRAVAASGADLLIVGDTGTGKEVVARAIHDLTHEQTSPFVALNCAALPRDMIEAELFGYEAGAFPSAARARFGKFEHAKWGTLFFDGIESMPMDVQAKLVRAVEERKVTRLGSHEPIALQVRFIAASKVDLETEAAEGRFRKDLLYQINVATIRMPSLKERLSDIPEIFVMLARDSAARHGIQFEPPSSEFLARLSDRQWPGNVRELRNVAERYVLGLSQQPDTMHQAARSLADRVASFEKQLIRDELALFGGRLKDVYESLGISRKALYEKMRKYEIDKGDL